VNFICSLWDYTHVVMNFLCGKSGTDGGTPRDDEWLSYFDVVVTGRSVTSSGLFCLNTIHLPLCRMGLTYLGVAVQSQHFSRMAIDPPYLKWTSALGCYKTLIEAHR
jgi:hypothetical protein